MMPRSRDAHHFDCIDAGTRSAQVQGRRPARPEQFDGSVRARMESVTRR
jgi:hypothetical protein